MGVEGVRVDRSEARTFADLVGISSDVPESELYRYNHFRMRDALPVEHREAARERYGYDPRDTATPDGMAELLAPGGVYVIGLSLIRSGEDEIEEDVWRGSDGERTVTEVSTALPPAPGTRAETIISHITIERAGAPPEHRDESFPLRTYTQEEWETAIERSALRVRAVFDIWGDRATPFSGGYFLYALAPR